MRRGSSVASILLASALVLPPLLNLISEFRRASRAGPSPPRLSFGFGPVATDFSPPPDQRRGTYIPARILDFRSPSTTRSTFFVHYPSGESVAVGSVVIAPPWILAGKIVKVWPRSGVALAAYVEDPSFRVPALAGSTEFLLMGRGEGLGLGVLKGDLSASDSALLKTSGAAGVFPGGLLVGYLDRARKGRVAPAFLRQHGMWLYLWRDPGLEALRRALGTAAGSRW